MKIIIIEDNDRYSTAIKNILGGFADEVVVVRTWTEATSYFNDDPDVIWIDLELPDSDVEDTIHKIKDLRAQDSDVVILVVSGHVDPKVTQLAEKSGVDVVECKAMAATPRKLFSLIMLAMTRAVARGAKRRLPELLERIAKFTAETFPQPQAQL